MADLLECLIQLRALEYSIARLERFVAAAPAEARPRADAVLERLLEAERAYARALPSVSLTPQPDVAALRHVQFAAARRATLDVLQRYSAEELAGPVDWAGRPGTSVADLVAIMLANDTERIGEIQSLVTSGLRSRPASARKAESRSGP